MTTRAIDDEPDRDLGKLLGLAAAAVVGGLFWGLIILAIRWVLQLPPPALLRLTAVALLFALAGWLGIKLPGTADGVPTMILENAGSTLTRAKIGPKRPG